MAGLRPIRFGQMPVAETNLSDEGSAEPGFETASPPALIRQLDYGRGRQPWRLRKRHVVIGALLVACVAGSWIMGRGARQKTQDLLYLRQAAAHVDSANTIVFESDAAVAQALIDAGTHVSLASDSVAPAVLLEPDCLRVLRMARGGNTLEAAGALIFLHELVTPSGARRIVAIQFLPYYLDGRTLPGAGLVAHIFEPGGLLSAPLHIGESHARLLVPEDEQIGDDVEKSSIAGDSDASGLLRSNSRSGCVGMTSPVLRQTFDPWGGQLDTLRWYAGQPDELDSAHFTIDYEIAGQRGTIDGYLSDDGRHVRMQARPSQSGDAGSTGFTRISGADSLR